MYTVTEQEIYIDTLKKNLEQSERHLQEVLSSRRWKLANILSSPYRCLKSLFCSS
jgi:hypothetical protein